MTIPTPPIAFRPPRLRPAPAQGCPPAPSSTPQDAQRAAFASAFADPELRKYLAARVAKLAIPEEDREDLVATTLAAISRRRDDPDPAVNEARMFALAKTIFEGKVADYWRHRAVVRKHVDPSPRVPGDEPDEPGEGPADVPNVVDRVRPPTSMTPERSLLAREKLAYVQRMAPELGMTESDVEAMYAMTWDEKASWVKLAAERGTSPTALRVRITRMQQRLEEGWARRTASRLRLSVTLLLLVLLAILGAVAAGRHAPPPEPSPAPPPKVRVEAPHAPAPSPTVVDDVPPDGPKSGGWK